MASNPEPGMPSQPEQPKSSATPPPLPSSPPDEPPEDEGSTAPQGSSPVTSDSAIDLGRASRGSSGGGPDSSMPWANLVDEGPSGESHPEVIQDSPSDVDVLRHALGGTGPKPASDDILSDDSVVGAVLMPEEEDIEETVSGVLNGPASGGEDSSKVDLTGDARSEPSSSEVFPTAEVVDEDVIGTEHRPLSEEPSEERTSTLGGPRQTQVVPDLGSVLEEGEADLTAPAEQASDSAVDLGTPPAGEVPESAVPVVGDSSPGLGELPHEPGDTDVKRELGKTSLAPQGVPTQLAGASILPEEAGDSGVNLGDPAGAGSGLSGRDLIAEAVESGVDLAGASMVSEGQEAASITHLPADHDEDVLEASAADEESVDLGALPPMEEEEAAGALEVMDEEEAATLSGEEAAKMAAGMMAGASQIGSSVTDEEAAAALAADSGDPFDHLGGGEAAALAASAEQGATVEGAAAAGVEEDEDETRQTATALVTTPPKTGEEEERKKPVPVPSRGGGWLAGAAVGVIGGALVCGGLWMFGIEPPRDLRFVEEEKKPAGRPGPQTQTPPSQTVTFAELISRGEFNRDEPAIDENKPEDLAIRGEFRWLRYLHKNPDPRQPVKLEDEAVQAALNDLKKANTAEALFWQGHIHETAKKTNEARKLYQEGLTKFPKFKTMFEGALARLDVNQGGMGPSSRLPREMFNREQLLLLLVALQAPMGDEGTEAGFSYWKAVKSARDGDFQAALAAIKQAREDHLKNLGKPLARNLRSDPRGEIFLQVCNQLEAYWRMRDALKDRLKDYPMIAGKEPDKAVEDLLAVIAGEKTKVADANKAKTEAENKLKDANTDLDRVKKEADNLRDMVKSRDQSLAAAAEKQKMTDKALDDEKAKVAMLDLARTQLRKTLDAVAAKLELKDVDPAKPDRLLGSLDDVLRTAKMKDPQGELRASRDEARRLQDALRQRRSPADLLTFWVALLADRTRRDLAAPALEDVARVEADASATPIQKAQAAAVRGLALRSQGQYEAARTALVAALRVAGDLPWKAVADLALKELSDPEVFYLPAAERALAASNFPAALALVNEGLAVFPQKTGKLLALRALIRLEQALAAGKVDPATPAIKEAQKDADAAVAAGSDGAGEYAQGRIAEEINAVEPAKTAFKKAIASAPANAPEAALYRLSLARLLQRTDSSAGSEKETVDLADEILRRGDIDRYPLIKGRALALKGSLNEALRTDVQGLRAYLNLEQWRTVNEVVEEALRKVAPPKVVTSLPVQAEKFYNAGLTAFYAGNNAEAERQLSKALDNFSNDARYWYFRGLARLRQGRAREAGLDFEKGAELEAADRPHAASVSAALERIQGAERLRLNEFRERVR